MTMRVFSHENLAIVHAAKNQLEAEGIDCLVKNEFHGGGGHVGLNIVPIELWVLQNEDIEKAAALLANNSDSTAGDAPAWPCDECGEENEGSFVVCWKCQTGKAS